MGFRVVSTCGARVECLLSDSCYQQSGQPGEVVGRHGQDEAGTHPFNPAIDDLSHATDGLGPTERLFDALAVLQGQGATLVTGHALVDR